MDEQAANSNAMTMHVTWRGSGAQNTSAITIRERSDLKCINLAYCDKWWVIVGDENDDIGEVSECFLCLFKNFGVDGSIGIAHFTGRMMVEARVFLVEDMFKVFQIFVDVGLAVPSLA